MRHVSVAVASALLLLLAAPLAWAHVDVQPALLESGREVELQVELPELRPGAPPTSLAVRGSGVRQLSTRADGRAGQETRWRVRVAVDAVPGPTELRLLASFADGSVVEVRRWVTVVPAHSDEDLPIGVAVATLGLLALVAAVAVLRRRASR